MADYIRPLFHTGEEYVKSLIANPELVDRLALTNDDKVTNIYTISHLHTCTFCSSYFRFIEKVRSAYS